MSNHPVCEVLQRLGSASLARGGADLTDGQLLSSFLEHRNTAAIGELVSRHGPMVWRVCRRILRDDHDAEDAFQATFLVLVRRAGVISPGDMVANWLYGVAYQTAVKARMMAAKRRAREKQVKIMPERVDMIDHDILGEDHAILDQELNRLPEKYRTAIVLCDLEGMTGKDAARRLRLPAATVSTRLARARAMLARRLARRGLAITGGAVTAMLSRDAATAAMPPAIARLTVKAASLIASGKFPTAALVSSNVSILTEGVIRTMLLTKLKIASACVFAIALAAGIAVLSSPRQQVYAIESPQDPMAVKPATRPVARPIPDRKPVEFSDEAQVLSAEWSRDGKSIAAVCQTYELVPGRENEQNILMRFYPNSSIKILDSATGKLIRSLDEEKKASIIAPSLSPDGKFLAYASLNFIQFKCELKIIDAATWKPIRIVSEDWGYMRIAFSPDGKTIAYGGRAADGSVYIRLSDVQDPKDVKTWNIVGGLNSLKFSPDGKMLAVGAPKEITLFDVEAGQPAHTFSDNDGRIEEIAFSPDGKSIASCKLNGPLKVWDIEAEKVRLELDCDSSWVGYITYSPDGKKMAATCTKNDNGKTRTEVRMWDAQTGEVKGKLAENSLFVPSSLGFSPDGKALAIGLTCRFWDGGASGKVKIVPIEDIKGERK
jgi:RNA polymerase sigma factor (sigma-70 family)